jgi:hypothetical protein
MSNTIEVTVNTSRNSYVRTWTVTDCSRDHILLVTRQYRVLQRYLAGLGLDWPVKR